jgi:hypothetical protein
MISNLHLLVLKLHRPLHLVHDRPTNQKKDHHELLQIEMTVESLGIYLVLQILNLRSLYNDQTFWISYWNLRSYI